MVTGEASGRDRLSAPEDLGAARHGVVMHFKRAQPEGLLLSYTTPCRPALLPSHAQPCSFPFSRRTHPAPHTHTVTHALAQQVHRYLNTYAAAASLPKADLAESNRLYEEALQQRIYNSHHEVRTGRCRGKERKAATFVMGQRCCGLASPRLVPKC